MISLDLEWVLLDLDRWVTIDEETLRLTDLRPKES